MMRCLKWIAFWCVCCAGLSWAAEPLPEGFVLNGISGVVVKGETSDDWSFVSSEELTYIKTVVPSGTTLRIVPSAGLEQIVAFAKSDSTIAVRMWGVLTQYHHENYLFPIQILPLVQSAPVAAQVEPVRPAEVNVPAPDPNVTEVMPAELLAMLRSQPRVDLAELSQAAAEIEAVDGTKMPEFSLIGKSGYITLGQNKHFVPDAFGRKIENTRYALLPCLTLEKAEDKLSGGFAKYRYNVSGIMTQYQGKRYLLLYRAERTYSNRNFTP